MKLYREVRVETADDLDQLEEYYVKETGPGAAWQIVLVPIEAEEEWTRLLHLDGRMDDYSFEAGDELPEEFFNGPPRTRFVTPWEEA